MKNYCGLFRGLIWFKPSLISQFVLEKIADDVYLTLKVHLVPFFGP